MVIDSVSVQPFDARTVKVYVPGALMVSPDELLTVELPSLQLYVPPPEPLTSIDVVVQVNTVVPVEFVITATGNDGSEVITIDSVSVQPLAPVTVTV
jgi:hypothetical protein